MSSASARCPTCCTRWTRWWPAGRGRSSTPTPPLHSSTAGRRRWVLWQPTTSWGSVGWVHCTARRGGAAVAPVPQPLQLCCRPAVRAHVFTSYLPSSPPPPQMVNWFLAAAPGHPALRAVMDGIVANAATRLFRDDMRDTVERTGPGAWTEAVLDAAFAHPPAKVPSGLVGLKAACHRSLPPHDSLNVQARAQSGLHSRLPHTPLPPG